MKRALPSYEDLEADGHEEGEIIVLEGEEVSEERENEDEDFVLKPVLPVGRYSSTFREGDDPSSGEQYLCTVRSQRLQMKRIIAVEGEERGNTVGVDLDTLCKKYGTAAWCLEVDRDWAEKYWKCYCDTEKTFTEQLAATEDNHESEHDLRLDFTATEWYNKLYRTEEIEPTLPILRAMHEDQAVIEKLVNLHRRWIEMGCDCEGMFEGKVEDDINSSSNAISTSNVCVCLSFTGVNDTTSKLICKVATWLQALLMSLDSRLTCTEIASLRQLALLLTERFPQVAEFREIVLVIAKRYGQADLIKFI